MAVDLARRATPGLLDPFTSAAPDGEDGAVSTEQTRAGTGLAERLRGATVREADLSGTTLQECTLTGVRLIGCDWEGPLAVSAFAGRLGTVVVEGVDVTAYVEAELDRRHPERVLVREARTADDLRAAWAAVEDAWTATLAEADRLPEEVRQARVGDEWSLVQTLRHLVMATDIWLGRMVQGVPDFHPLGLPPTGEPAPEGTDPDRPTSYAEAAAAHAGARARVRAALADLTDAALERVCTGVPAPGREELSRPVAGCLLVVLREHVEHRRYAVRDLAVLTATAG